ncbi:uncharacterized protein AAG666_017645 isoform 2-T9 [Megaptera novaeangliae]
MKNTCEDVIECCCWKIQSCLNASQLCWSEWSETEAEPLYSALHVRLERLIAHPPLLFLNSATTLNNKASFNIGRMEPCIGISTFEAAVTSSRLHGLTLSIVSGFSLYCPTQSLTSRMGGIYGATD